ncbi:unnamed protein product [Rotaria socialis]|uniref:Uncharacterized protein n=1 Tax=Rotaria socialis TaxID=392032 RepID=A0A821GQW0_9BILA|nr:unnamed protein product [Rotaria socialis]CAF4667405.1 unnamed protein product [Rotaria socialis]
MSATVEPSFNDLVTTVDPSSSGTSASINHEKATTSSNWNGVVTACQCCDMATTFYHVYYPLIKLYIDENERLLNEAQLNIRDGNEWNDGESTTEIGVQPLEEESDHNYAAEDLPVRIFAK